jgi:hypothetical protein
LTGAAGGILTSRSSPFSEKSLIFLNLVDNTKTRVRFIWTRPYKGKPVERRRRKVTGLKGDAS